MTRANLTVPTTTALAGGLASIFQHPGEGRGAIRILGREMNVHTSTFPTELVTIASDVGSERRIFCKYGAGHEDPVYGHKGGVPYEAQVYDRVLDCTDLPLAKCYGAHVEARSGQTWLFLECFSSEDRLKMQEDQPAALAMAADWIGRFHASYEGRTNSASLRFLNRYDADYYSGWIQRTLDLSKPLHPKLPWLEPLCKISEEALPALLCGRPTILHGEYYPSNILARPESAYPIDWESAAIGAGEIDLTSLIECWPVRIQARSIEAYRQARWHEDAPEDFVRTLEAARLYMQFRWLGDRPDWTTGRGCMGRFRQLYRAGRRLRLV